MVLEVRDLSITFTMYNARAVTRKQLCVMRDLDVAVDAGEIVAVAGASGSGKSLLAHAILGLLPKNAALTGTMKYCGENLTADKQREARGRDMVLVPQSVSYLDPLMKAGAQVEGTDGSVEERRAVFRRYGLDADAAALYPFQLSGGMARRVLLATAVMKKPRLIIADEPTPGMSVELARRAMGHFRELADEGAAVLLITHDIDLAVEYADRVAVFYAGSTLEIARASEFRDGTGTALRHPYTRALYRAIPQNGFTPIPGSQPYAGNLPRGCLFAPRCSRKHDACAAQLSIPMKTVRGGEVRCLYAE